MNELSTLLSLHNGTARVATLRRAGLALAPALMLMACSSEPEVAELPKMNSAAFAQSADLQLGGNVVAAGPYYVEVRPEAQGQVAAAVYDHEGEPIDDPEDAKVVVEVTPTKGDPVDVPLVWDGDAEVFVPAAEAEVPPLKSGHLSVRVAHGDVVAEGQLDAAVTLPAPEIGGTVVMAGPHPVEVRPSHDGQVLVKVHGRRQIPNAKMTVVVNNDDEPQRVDVVWDPKAAMFVGRVEGEVELTRGPVVVEVVEGPKQHRARLRDVVVVTGPAHGGHVVMVGHAPVELVPLEDGEVEAHVHADAGWGPKATLTLAVAGAAPAILVWDAKRRAYRGRFDARIDLRRRPVDIVVKAKGRHHKGHFRMPRGRAVGFFGIAPPGHTARLELRGPHGKPPKIKVKGHKGIKVKGPSVRARIEAPSVRIKAPKVKVRAGASSMGHRSSMGGMSRGGASVSAMAGASFGF